MALVGIAYPPRLRLAIERVEAALDRADFDSGHIITGDNVRISDVRLLLVAAEITAQGMSASGQDAERLEGEAPPARSAKPMRHDATSTPNPPPKD